MSPIQKRLSDLSVSQLIDVWESVETLPVSPDLAVVRGELMDELESRDPHAFDQWLTADNFEYSRPRKFFKGALQ